MRTAGLRPNAAQDFDQYVGIEEPMLNRLFVTPFVLYVQSSLVSLDSFPHDRKTLNQTDRTLLFGINGLIGVRCLVMMRRSITSSFPRQWCLVYLYTFDLACIGC